MSDKATNVIPDNKKIIETCHEIEKVFETRKCIDAETRLSNSKAMYKLFLLCSYNEENNPQDIHLRQNAINYLCNNLTLPNQLVEIIAESEDLATCLYVIDIFYQILINTDPANESDKMTMRKVLSLFENFTQLLESSYSLHSRFYENNEYRERLLDIQTKLFHIIITLQDAKKSRESISNASENTVRFIGQLTITYYRNREFVTYLLTILKALCFKKSNCEILSSSKFFDALYYSCKTTRKTFTVALILKLMSREATALNCMSRSEKIFNLILDLANYTGKRPVNKRTLMTTLYRITKTIHGLNILLKNENFNKLLKYFLKNENPDVFHHRMGTIKAYTILNRSVTKIVVPSSQLNMALNLPDDPLIYDEHSSEEDSEQEENDDSDEESQEGYESFDDEDEDDSSDSIEIKFNNLKKAGEESVSRMNVFFKEILDGFDDGSSDSKLKIFEGVEDNLESEDGEELDPWQILIEDRVHRYANMDKHAYPDALLLEPESDQHFLDPATNFFSADHLAQKLKYAKGMSENKYKSKVVYDLDELYGDYKKPLAMPHPSTFVPRNVSNQIHTPKATMNTLRFESRFECGNLRRVKQIEKFEYELLISPDTCNSGSGHQWFYFQVSNMVAGVTYTFNIINFLKVNSQYNYGMQPVLFSTTDYALNGTGWRRAGERIVYYGNNYTDENGTRQYRSLSFCVIFRYANDYVYLAYHYPYTYTRLMTLLYPISNYDTDLIYARVDKLCDTVNGANEVPLLTVTGHWNHPKSLKIPINRRPLIFITARVHPGETNSSWIMEGIIKYLLNETDEQAIKVREHFIFKIIPMLNPEGVIYGNTRSGLTGKDLNRCWSKPNQITCPEIYYTKRLAEYVKKDLRQRIAAFIDIHGHSRRKFFFFYGCNPKLSWNENDRKNENCTETIKLLPQMMQMINPNVKLNFCRYKIEKNRESTARVVMWREFGIQHSYTLECSYCSGENKQTMNTKMLTEIGANLVVALEFIRDEAFATNRNSEFSYSCNSSYEQSENNQLERLIFT